MSPKDASPMPDRAYGGLSASERRAVRRRALVESGRALWCDQGWAGVTMRGVCVRSGLTARYFYESFDDRDALLVAIVETVREEAMSLLLGSMAAHQDDPLGVQLRVALEAVVRFVARDAGSAQIFFGDHGGNDVLEGLRRDTIRSAVELFTETFRPHVLPGADEVELRFALYLGIGGFIETVSAWRSGVIEATTEQLVDMFMDMARRLGAVFVDLA